MPTLRLSRRLAALEEFHAPAEAVVFTPEQEARAKRIIDAAYTDPVRYADRIVLFEQIRRERALESASS